MAWTEEQKAKVIEAYEAAGPTPENSTEIIKDIAEEFEQSPNGVRMILVRQAKGRCQSRRSKACIKGKLDCCTESSHRSPWRSSRRRDPRQANRQGRCVLYPSSAGLIKGGFGRLFSWRKHGNTSHKEFRR